MSTDLAQQLFDVAFGQPRDPRSTAYKAGVLAALRYRIHGVRMRDPYGAGTAESDAWYSGAAEGHALCRKRQVAQ